MIENFSDLIEDDSGVSSTAKKSMIKRIEAQKEAFEQQVRDLSAIQREDTDIYFDELGVDGLFVDEAHFYKNALGSAKANKLGIAATNPSQRAEDMIQKTKWLFSKIGHRNVYLLTATPVVNSPIEVWHMLQLCAPDMLEENSIDSLDNFINLFVKEENKIVKKTTGEYAEKMVVSGYINLPEMRRIIDRIMDIKSYDQLQQFYVDHPEYVTDESGKKSLLKPSFLRPKANYQNQIVKPSEVHELLFEDIILRAEGILACMKDRNCETRDNFLVLTGDGSRIATDLRIYDGNFDGFSDDSLKVQALIPKVVESYNETVRSNPEGEQKMLPATDWDENIYGSFFSRRGTGQIRNNPATGQIRNQIIFSDFITTKDGKSFHQIIKDELVKKGIPASQIAIINGNTIGTTGKKGKDRPVKASDDKEVLKKEVQDDFNAGKFRVLIGNKSIAEGMNLQRWTTDLHHLDVPYTPSDIQQRNGRGLRQGNKYDQVNINYYLMQDSFDQYRLELVNKKQGWIDQLFYGEGREVDSDDEAQSLNYEEMVSATTSDPEIKQFFEAKAKLKNLNTRISSLEAEKQRIEGSLVQARKNVQTFIERVNAAKEKENAIKGATIPYSYADAQKMLDDDAVEVFRLMGFSMNELSTSIRSSLVESRYFSSMYVKVKIDVPQTNAAARVHIQIWPPSETNRSMFSRTSWRGLKTMAQAELKEQFGFTDEDINSNTFTQIASVNDFEAHYGIDLEQEKVQSELTWEQVKQKHRMFDNATWQPVVEKKIAQLMLAMEKSWVQQVDARLQLLDEGKDDRTRKVSQLETELKEYTKNLNDAEADLDKNEKLVSDLIDKVKELTQTTYKSRPQLYAALNDVAPKYGIKKRIPVKEVGVFTVSGESKEPTKDEQIESLIRDNPSAKFVYIGVCNKISIDQGKPEVVELQGNHAMLTNKGLDKLYIVPFDDIDEMPNGIQDEKAEDIFEMWHNYDADDKDMTLRWPERSKAKPVGSAVDIYYISDKIMQRNDRKGKMNMYHHEFDRGKRPAFVKGNILIVSNLKIDERGILN
jgi:hypothetical protein